MRPLTTAAAFAYAVNNHLSFEGGAQRQHCGAQVRLQKKILLSIYIPLGVLAGASFGLFLMIWAYADRPLVPDDLTNVIVEVRPGQSVKTIAEILHHAGIINNPWKFRLLARSRGHDKQLKAGEYVFSAAMTPKKILEIMVKGAVRLHKLSIPEGYNLYQIAELIAKAELGTAAAFIQVCTNAALVRAKGVEAETLEGYLFPDTYFFPKSITIEQMAMTMVNRFFAVFRSEWKTRAENLGYTVHQVVTLASMIEKETAAPFERAMISSVFHNRLAKKMRLESDPTVIYGLKNFDGNLTRRHLDTLTPYNTYRIAGLPPGPIANPGRESLAAALFPQETAFIYFVSKKDNTHHFSVNLEDHNRAVSEYQLNRQR
jgi:UPF0755 protein